MNDMNSLTTKYRESFKHKDIFQVQAFTRQKVDFHKSCRLKHDTSSTIKLVCTSKVTYISNWKVKSTTFKLGWVHDHLLSPLLEIREAG